MNQDARGNDNGRSMLHPAMASGRISREERLLWRCVTLNPWKPRAGCHQSAGPSRSVSQSVSQSVKVQADSESACDAEATRLSSGLAALRREQGAVLAGVWPARRGEQGGISASPGGSKEQGRHFAAATGHSGARWECQPGHASVCRSVPFDRGQAQCRRVGVVLGHAVSEPVADGRSRIS